jgi:hypothetical protein
VELRRVWLGLAVRLSVGLERGIAAYPMMLELANRRNGLPRSPKLQSQDANSTEHRPFSTLQIPSLEPQPAVSATAKAQTDCMPCDGMVYAHHPWRWMAATPSHATVSYPRPASCTLLRSSAVPPRPARP